MFFYNKFVQNHYNIRFIDKTVELDGLLIHHDVGVNRRAPPLMAISWDGNGVSAFMDGYRHRKDFSRGDDSLSA